MMAEAEAEDVSSLMVLERLEEIVFVREYLTFSSLYTNLRIRRRSAGG